MLELSRKSETPEITIIVSLLPSPLSHTLSMFPTPQTHQDWKQASNPLTYELQPCNVNQGEKLPLGRDEGA